MSERPKFVDRKTGDLQTIESGVRNKFLWSWLEEKDCNGDFLSDYVRKTIKPGNAHCLFCDDKLDYGKKGKSFIHRHAKSDGHVLKRNAVKNTQTLPAILRATASLERGDVAIPSHADQLPYGAAENVSSQHFSPASTST